MDKYKTTLEIAAEWGVTSKTVQLLCKKGKLDGAVKRSGSWFIPGDIALPLRNTKSKAQGFDFVGTKKRIFDNAIRLVTNYGFESVSIKDIAEATGINQSAVYNHFSSKQKILDIMYEYYAEHFNDNRKPVKEMKEILNTGTKEEFCAALMFTFEPDGTEKHLRMKFITKIIYTRFYQDEKARDIFMNIMNSDLESYVVEILEYGQYIGVVIGTFDINTYAKFLIGQRHIMEMKALAVPSYLPEQLEEEKLIMKMSTDILPYHEKSRKTSEV